MRNITTAGVVVSVVVGAATFVRAVPGGARQASADQPRSAANYVEIPVRVTDSNRRFVGGLSVADFEVSENGVLKSVATADEVHLAAPTAPRRASGQRQNAAGDDRQQAAYLVVVDDNHVTRDGSPRVQSALRQFVERQTRPQDFVGIAYTSGTPGQELTEHRGLLGEAIGRLHGNYDPRDTRSLKEQAATQALRIVTSAAQSLQLHAAEQPTALVLVTAGVGCSASARASDRNTVLCGTALSDAVRQAVVNGVTIYGIDRSTSVNPFLDSPDTIRDGRDRPTLSGTEMPRGSENGFDAMRVLADQTGGLALSNADNLTPAFERVVRENGSYYRVGYYAIDTPRERIGANIEIRVKRQNVSAFYPRRRPRATP